MACLGEDFHVKPPVLWWSHDRGVRGSGGPWCCRQQDVSRHTDPSTADFSETCSSPDNFPLNWRLHYSETQLGVVWIGQNFLRVKETCHKLQFQIFQHLNLICFCLFSNLLLQPEGKAPTKKKVGCFWWLEFKPIPSVEGRMNSEAEICVIKSLERKEESQWTWGHKKKKESKLKGIWLFQMCRVASWRNMTF